MVSKEGNKVIAVLPERTSSDRIHLLKALGVEIIRTPTEARREAAENMYSTAYKLSEQLQNSIVIDEVRLETKRTRFTYHRSNMFVTATLTRILLSQTNVPSGVYDDLAEEILQQTKLTLDHIFIGVETGSTISRVAKALKKKCSQIKVYGIEPTDSVFSGNASQQHHKRTVGV